MKDRKKIVIIMGVVLALLIVVGVVIGVSQSKKNKELEEQGIYYQNGSESVEEWDEDDFIDESIEADEVVSDDNSTQNGSDETAESIDSSSSTSDNKTDKNTTGANKEKPGKVDKNKTDKNNTGSNNQTSGNNSNSGNGSTGNSDSSDKTPSKVPSAGKSTYEKYISMSPEQQQKYFESFDSEQDFFDWYREAKAEYDKKNKGNEISGGSIDIGDYMD